MASLNATESTKYKIRKHFSLLNRFTPTILTEEEIEHPATLVLYEIIENVLWIEAGYYDGSETSCETLTPTGAEIRKRKLKDGQYVDSRLEYWREFLANKRIMEKRIMRKTGKDRFQVLLNITHEHRRKEMVKRILDYADRFRPDKLKIRREEPPQLSAIDPCADNIYETLPTSEKTGIPALTIIDTPKLSMKEEGIEDFQLKNWNWLKSKYLAAKLFCKAEDIRRIIPYFPDIAGLEIAGSALDIYKKGKKRKTSKGTEDIINFQVIEVDPIGQEENFEYVIKANEHLLNAENKHTKNIDFHIIFENHRYEKAKAIMVTLQNCGWKTIDFHWDCEKREESRFAGGGFKRIPAFYFDKNPFRLIPGQIINYEVMFCSKKMGIYNEVWYLLSEPSFFSPGNAIVVNLFGHSRQQESIIKLFSDLKSDLTTRAAKNMTLNLLNIVSIQAVPEPVPKAPYIRYFTEREIFSNLYPDINYNELGMEELKALYEETNIATGCRCCREWNYDIESLKKQILSINEAEKRKALYFQLIGIIKRMKQAPKMPKCAYEQQTFLLVRSVIIATMDKIDNLAEQLRSLLTKTELPLDFHEVLVLDRQRKPAEMTLNIPLSTDEETDYMFSIEENEIEEITQQSITLTEESQSSSSSVDPTAVIKSETVKKKQKQLFMDSFYLQVFAHLGYAAEEIAGVIEGARNLF